MTQPVGTEAFLEVVPSEPRGNLDHEIHVLRHPRLGRGLIGDPECDGGAADESDLVEERRQLLRGALDHRDAHDPILSCRSLAAS